MKTEEQTQICTRRSLEVQMFLHERKYICPELCVSMTELRQSG